MGPNSFPFLAVLCLLSMDAKCVWQFRACRHCSSGDACIGFDCAHWVTPSRDDAWLAWAEFDINPSRATVNDHSF